MTLSNDAHQWVVHYLQLNAAEAEEVQGKGIQCLKVSQLELLMSAIRPHMTYAVRSPSEKEEFVEVIEEALSASKSDNIVETLLASHSYTITSGQSPGGVNTIHDDDDTKGGSRFRQAFGKAMLKMMGSRLDKKKKSRGRQSFKKANTSSSRRRTQSHDGLISSDDEGASNDGSNDGSNEGSGEFPAPPPVVRHSSLIYHPSRPESSKFEAAQTNASGGEYTTALNDSSRGARPIRHAQVRRLSNESTSSAMSDVSSDGGDQIGTRSNDGYASSDDENFMNDVAHKALPGHGYAISDDGSVDSFD